MHIRLREFRSPVGVRIEVAEIGVVLQITLARFVTRWTVERMIDQVHLQYELARVLSRFGMGEDFHAFAERRSTRFDQAATLAENFDSANTAGTPGAQQWLIAEVGYLDVRHARGLEDRGPGGNGHILTIDLPCDQLCFSSGRHRLDSASISLGRIPGNGRRNPLSCPIVALDKAGSHRPD